MIQKKNCKNAKEQRRYEVISETSWWVLKFQIGWTTMNYEISKNLTTQKVMIFDTIQSVLLKGRLWGYVTCWVQGLAFPLIEWATYSPKLDSIHSCQMCTLSHMSSTSLSALKFLSINVSLMIQKTLQDLSIPQSCQCENQLRTVTLVLFELSGHLDL